MSRSTPRGGFVGVVDLVNIILNEDLDPGKRYASIFINPRRIPFVAAPGRLGLFVPRPELFKPTPEESFRARLRFNNEIPAAPGPLGRRVGRDGSLSNCVRRRVA